MLYHAGHRHEEAMYVELRQGPVVMASCFTNVAELIEWDFARHAMPRPVLIGHSKRPFGNKLGYEDDERTPSKGERNGPRS